MTVINSTDSSAERRNEVGAIVGAIISVLVVSLALIAVLAIIFVVWRKYKHGEDKHELMEMDSKEGDSALEEKVDL